MSTELAVRQSERPRGTVMTLDEKIRYAEHVAQAGLVPSAYRRQPANVLIALEYAEALGVQPINAMTSIHVIEGKPSASADLMAVMVRRAGHKLRVRGDDTYAEATLIRADDPEFPFEARWDIPKAERANLARKDVWKSYPGAMLKARAISEVCRTGASEALFGVIYTPEELGAEVDGEGNVIKAEATRVDQPAAPAAPAAAPAAPAASRPADPAPAPDPALAKEPGEWLESIAAIADAANAKQLWAQARAAGQLHSDVEAPDGSSYTVAERITARVEELNRDAGKPVAGETTPAADAPADGPVSAPSTRADEPAADDVPEGVGEPLEGELLEADGSPAGSTPAAPAEPDSEDLRRNTPQRKAVVTQLIEEFGGREVMEAAAEQVFGLHPDQVATRRLREWLGQTQVANRAGSGQ